MRLRRLSAESLILLRIIDIYPLGVFSARLPTARPEQLLAVAKLEGVDMSSVVDGKAGPTAADGGEIAAREQVFDPVCGMRVDPHATAHAQAYGGQTYWFCSAGCRAKFAANPA